MSRNSELMKNTFWISFAQIMAQAVNFLFIPLYTSVLSTVEYGQADLYAAVRMILVSVIFLGLEQSIFRFCVSESDFGKKQEFFSTGIMAAAGLVMIYSVLYWIGDIIWHFPYAQLVYAYYTVYSLFQLFLHIARGLGRTRVYAVSTVLGTVCTVFLNIVFVVYLKYGVKGVLAGNVIAYVVAIIYMLFQLPLWKMFVFKWKKSTAKAMLQYSLPLVLNNVMGWVITSSDRMIITVLLGNAMNGIYALACKVYSVLMVLTNGFTIAWAETAVKVIQQPDHKAYYQKIISISMDVYFMIISGLIVILPFLFDRFINIEYRDAYYHIPIIVYATFWYTMSAVIGYILLAYKKSSQVGIGTFLIAVMNLAVHFCLIGSIGLFAASVSTLISYAGLFAFRYFFVWKHEHIYFPRKKALLQLGIYLLLCGCYYRRMNGTLIIGIFIYVMTAVVYIKIYRNMIIGLLTKMCTKMKARTNERRDY